MTGVQTCALPISNNIRKVFSLEKADDVRGYVDLFRRKFVGKNGKDVNKAPKIQRLITPVMVQRKHRLFNKKLKARVHAKQEAAAYSRLASKRAAEAKVAQDLPRCLLSDYLESRVFGKLKEAMDGDTAAALDHDRAPAEIDVDGVVAATFGLENGGRLPHAVPLREAVGLLQGAGLAEAMLLVPAAELKAAGAPAGDVSDEAFGDDDDIGQYMDHEDGGGSDLGMKPRSCCASDCSASEIGRAHV